MFDLDCRKICKSTFAVELVELSVFLEHTVICSSTEPNNIFLAYSYVTSKLHIYAHFYIFWAAYSGEFIFAYILSSTVCQGKLLHGYNKRDFVLTCPKGGIVCLEPRQRMVL